MLFFGTHAPLLNVAKNYCYEFFKMHFQIAKISEMKDANWCVVERTLGFCSIFMPFLMILELITFFTIKFIVVFHVESHSK